MSTRLAKAPVLWRSKKVMPFSTWQATGLHLKTPGGDVALEKKGDTSLWRLADGTEADQSRVTDRLTALAGLEATDYDLMAPLTDEMGSAEVALAASGDGGEPSTLSFTFFAPLSEGGRAMVRVTGRETVMGVDPSEVQRIIGDLDDLRSPPKEESDAAAE